MQIPSDAQLTHAQWQKSTRSGGGEATCVEVAPVGPVSRDDANAEH